MKIRRQSIFLFLGILVLVLPGTTSAERIFEPHYFFPSGGESPWAILSDVDQDSDPDIVTANADSQNICVFSGNGNGTFAESPICFPSGGDGSGMVAADYLNGDSYPDLAVPNPGSNTVCVFIGNGNGTFQQRPTCFPSVGDHPVKLVIGSMNAGSDSNLDLAVVNFHGNNVCVFLGDGDGDFTPGDCYAAAAGGNPNAIAKGYLNADAHLDLVVTNRSTDNVSVLLGDGNGAFLSHQEYLSGDHPISVVIEDLNEDGDQDLAVSNFWSSDVCVLAGNGDGSFAAPGIDDCYEVGNGYDYGPSWIVTESLNKDTDSRKDLATVSYSNWVDVLLGDEGGGFQTPTEIYQVGAHPNSIDAGDLDGDGDVDLVIGNAASDTISVLMNNPCIDEDMDGYGASESSLCTLAQLDCNDGDDTIHPGAYEGPMGHGTCTDGVNNDCDGWTDGTDSGCQDQETMYVDASTERRGTGLVDEPFETIGEALSVANSRVDPDLGQVGDEILVEPGTYGENIVWPGEYDVKLICMSGDSEECTVQAADSGAPVVSGSFSTDTRLTVQGMTLTGGSDGISLDFDMTAMVDEVKILGNVIRQNTGGSDTHYGVRVEAGVVGDRVILSENTIEGHDIGVLVNGHTSAVLTSNTVTGNVEEGIFLYPGGDGYQARLNDNEVSNNGQGEVGKHGIRIGATGTDYYDSVEVEDNRIHGNLTECGAYVEVGDSRTIEVSSNTVWDHTAGGADAGGLCVKRINAPSTPEVAITHNKVWNVTSKGIRLDWTQGSGLSAQLADMIVKNNLAYGNGVGLSLMRNVDTEVELRNNTVVGNTVVGFELTGVEPASQDPDRRVELVNMILWGNGDDISVEADCMTHYGLRYSDVQDGEAEGDENVGDPVETMLHVDPLFTGGDRYELSELPVSPCKGAGVWESEEEGADMGYTGGEEGYNTLEEYDIDDPVPLAASGVSAAFNAVENAGRTWGYKGGYYPGVPKAYRVGFDDEEASYQFWDIKTTAVYHGHVRVCLPYTLTWFPGLDQQGELKLKILRKHSVGEAFSPLENVDVNTTGRIVCGDSLAGLSAFVVASPICEDVDGDGYGDPASEGCEYPLKDCDDTDPGVCPGATEGPSGDTTCSDGKDNDCDLLTDLADGGCVSGSCSATAAASVAGSSTRENPRNGLWLLCYLVPLAMAGIMLRICGKHSKKEHAS